MKAQPINCYRQRPVYGLFDALIRLRHGSGNSSQMATGLFENEDACVLASIAESAYTLQRRLHLGTAVIARCLALAAPDVPDSDQCSANTVEAVGWALAEMADMAAICHHLEVTARRVVRESPQKVEPTADEIWLALFLVSHYLHGAFPCL